MNTVRMADVGSKEETGREATAVGSIRLKPSTIEQMKAGCMEKGDVLAVATVAAVHAVKKTSENIPLCHQIPIDHIGVDFTLEQNGVAATVKVKASAKTGVEMEALSGVSAALLTVWDMVKKYEKDDLGQYPSTCIEGIRVVQKIKGGGRD